MFTYKIFNNIAEEGLSILKDNRFLMASENPDGLMLRSHKLVKEEFGDKNFIKSLKEGYLIN